MLTVSDLSFSIEEKSILENISFTFPASKVTAIVGPNGVGKTTTVQILSNIIQCKNNSVSTILNQNKVVYLDLDYLIFEELTSEEYVSLIAQYNKKDHKEVKGLLNYFEPLNIRSFLHTKLKGLSLGQKQKLLIVTGFLSNADILIFDEPFNGLDYKSERIFKSILKENKYNFTILITTHNFEDIETYTDKCIIMKNHASVTQVTNDDKARYKRNIFSHLDLELEINNYGEC